MLTLGGGNAKAVQIISEAHAQINAAIQSELDRGTTLSDATGGYTGAPRKVILVVVERRNIRSCWSWSTGSTKTPL